MSQKVYLMYSAKAAALPNYDWSMADTRRVVTERQKHVVVCDATTGKVHTVTYIINDPEDYKFPDKEILAVVDPKKLIWFETNKGRESIFSAMEISQLSDEEKARVTAAHNKHYPPAGSANRPTGGKSAIEYLFGRGWLSR